MDKCTYLKGMEPNSCFVILQCTDKLERDRLIQFLNKLILHQASNISTYLFYNSWSLSYVYIKWIAGNAIHQPENSGCIMDFDILMCSLTYQNIKV